MQRIIEQQIYIKQNSIKNLYGTVIKTVTIFFTNKCTNSKTKCQCWTWLHWRQIYIHHSNRRNRWSMILLYLFTHTCAFHHHKYLININSYFLSSFPYILYVRTPTFQNLTIWINAFAQYCQSNYYCYCTFGLSFMAFFLFCFVVFVFAHQNVHDNFWFYGLNEIERISTFHYFTLTHTYAHTCTTEYC